MKTKRIILVSVLAVFVLVAALIVGAAIAEYINPGEPSGNGIQPIGAPGNATCSEQGFAYEYKIDPPNAGTYSVPYIGDVTVSNSNGIYFDWSSQGGIDAVIVKGGPDSNVFIYDPPGGAVTEATSDTGLHSPINSNTGNPYGLSHISFCFDMQLEVSKTAETSYKRTYTWAILKTAQPESWDLFTGDKGTTKYSVMLDATPADSDFKVEGEITIYNPDPSFSAKIASVADVVSPAQSATVDCGVSFPYTLVPHGTLSCNYSAGPATPNPFGTLNTATVTAAGDSKVDGGTATAAVDFAKATITYVDEQVSVSDTYQGSLGSLDATKDALPYTYSYERTFNCDDDEGKHENTASYVTNDTATTNSSAAAVTVNCYALQVDKTVKTSFNRQWTWTIDKSASPASWDLFKGDSGTSAYEVTVDADYEDKDYKVSGAIEVYNPAPIAATIKEITDLVSPDIQAKVDCGETFPYSLPAGETLKCSYTADVPDDADRDNTATATLQNFAYAPDLTATQAGTTDFAKTVDVSFEEAEMTEIDECIQVTDTNDGTLGTVCADSVPKKFTYTREFTCNADEGKHENTATLTTNDTSTTKSADAEVAVNCNELEVTKDADPKFTRQYTWEIDKNGDQNNLTLAIGQSFIVNYTVKVDVKSHTDKDFSVSGQIEIYNPAAIGVKITDVADEISGIGSVEVDCGVTFPYTLAAKDTLTCTYSADLPNGDSRTNKATATIQNYAYPATGPGEKDGTTAFSKEITFSFGDPTSEIDECIDVEDDQYGSLGTVCANKAPKTFTYSLTVGPYQACGLYDYVNTASFVTNDTSATGSDSWTVAVDVPCQGCTLTIGYWKNHAGFGPQDDMVSDLLPLWLGDSGGAKSVQVSSAGQAVTLLGMSGDASNGINKLYAQLLGAKLNIADGANGSAVSATIAAADAFLANYNAADWDSLSKAQKKDVLGWASTLDNYNNGSIGPGHCDQ